VNLSRTGILLDASTALTVADPIALRLNGGGSTRLDAGSALSGHVVRVVSVPARPSQVRVGVAIDTPLPEDELMTHVSLSSAASRTLRSADR
jgi:hypothetical protein